MIDEEDVMIYSQVNVKTQVVVGDPKDKICETVENLNADLLVLGSRAYGPIKRYINLFLFHTSILPLCVLVNWWKLQIIIQGVWSWFVYELESVLAWEMKQLFAPIVRTRDWFKLGLRKILEVAIGVCLERL